MCNGDRLACQDEPERWFDQHDRAYALQRCLGCPARPGCAAEALRSDATFGMWAGIWIDDNIDDVARYLHAIAAAPPSPPPRAPARRRRRSAPPPPPAAQPTPEALIVDRASGHCEVMTPYCRLGIDKVNSRVPQHDWHGVKDPSSAYAVCRNCAAVLADVDASINRRLGYLVEPAQRCPQAPFYWRQARWVVLRANGRLEETPLTGSRVAAVPVSPAAVADAAAEGRWRPRTCRS